jgi:hypothetical protein
MRAMRWILQFRTSGGSRVPEACVLKQPMAKVVQDASVDDDDELRR